MSPKRRKISRPLGKRRYRKMFVLAVEGRKTEPQYFAIFNDQNSVIQVKILNNNHNKSAPLHVLAQMEKHLKKEGLKNSDEAWLVVDKDQWTDEQLSQLHQWSQEADNRGFALSNPKFEFWLLLHYEDGKNVKSSQECSDKLKRHLPDYDKGINVGRGFDAMVADAIDRAEKQDNPPCNDWPHTTGTTVYKLVKNIRKIHSNS